MASDDEIARMTATELAARVRARELAAVEVADAILGRMERIDTQIHAFCTPAPDLALAMARRIDADLAAGRPVGPLAGVPVGIKDLIFTKDIATVSGSRLYRDFMPEEDDVVVERLRGAGSIFLGKTNVSELGYAGVGHNPVFETTRNPWNTDLTSGGSSAGSGAAVAAGLGPLALGSDGGGSIRVPASLCGVFGFKPSMGRVPLYPGCRDERYPGASSWESIEHIGPMSRTVEDAALMMSAIAGPDDRDRHSLPRADFDWLTCIKGDLTGLRVAYSADFGYVPVDPCVRKVARDAAQAFGRDLGCIMEETNPGFEDMQQHFWGLVALDTDLKGMRALAGERADEMSPHLVEFLRRPWTAEDMTNAVLARKKMYNAMWRFMHRYDLLLTPTTAVPAFPVGIRGPETIDGRTVPPIKWTSFTFPFNMTGQPAATVPAGFTADGLPVGLQIVGRHLDDPLVLRASACFEAVRPWAHRWPSLVGRKA